MKKTISGLCLFFILAFMISFNVAPGEEIPKPDKIVTFKKISRVKLKAHIFTPPEHQRNDKRPAIVFFFGGAWVGGTPSQFYPQCRYLASRGMVAISAEYRVQSRHNTSPFECVSDGKSAVRWIRKHAGELGIDPDRIAAGGGSAGGHVAAACALLSKFDETFEDRDISSKPSALVLFNPVFDNGPGGWGYDRVKDRWKDISPLHNISPEAPPTIVLLGTKDDLIPVSTAERYRELMMAAGARCDLLVYTNQPHGFFNYNNGKIPHYYVTLFEVDRFLASLGYLDGEPTIQMFKVRFKRY